MKRAASFLLCICLAAGIAAQGCSKDKDAPKAAAAAPAKQAEPARSAKPDVIKVSASRVEGRTVERTIEATGTLAPWDEVIVGSELAGTVDSIKADLGDKVRAGQVIAVLDQREAKLNHEQAKAAHRMAVKTLEREKARLQDAKTTLSRYDELFKQGMVSTSQHDNAVTQHDVAVAQFHQAEAGVEEASARVNLAEKKLMDTAVKSPINGEVSKRFVSQGESIKEKAQMFTVVSTGNLKFRGTIAETSVPRIKRDQEVLVSVEAYGDRAFKGRIKRISPSVDAQTRTLEVEAVVPNQEGLLKPGFFARAIVNTHKEKGVPFVPEAAVYSFVGVNKVFVLNGDVAGERQIKTGAKDGGLVELLDTAIKPGEVVATSNLSNLFEGAKVVIQK